MSFNMTNITGLSSSQSYYHTQGNISAQGFGLSADIANNLGYGIGRAIRGAFDSLWGTWQKMSTPEPSAEEIALQRNTMIYQGGLKECVKQLGPALANLQMNPKDRGALKKVEQLSTDFARYLKPSYEENLRGLQSKILKTLEERVSATAHLNIQRSLKKWMPVFFQGKQMEPQLADVRQSQVMQEFPGTKARCSPQELASFNGANGFARTDSAGIDNGFYASYQLTDGVRGLFSSLDTRLSNLFSIFPGVSAEPVEPTAEPTRKPTKVLIAVLESGTELGLFLGGSCLIIIFCGVGWYLCVKRLRKEESPELSSLVNPLSTQQKVILI
jgi:hypothetical protein